MIPIDVVEKTFKAMTQLANNYLCLPIRQHFKSRFLKLNVNCLREKYATDTWFLSVLSLSGCNEVPFFICKKSRFMKVYRLKSESQENEALKYFVREVGAPYHIMNDNSKIQTSKAWQDILNQYNIVDSTCEPHNQQ